MFPFAPGSPALAPLISTGSEIQSRFNPFDLRNQNIQMQGVQAETQERQANTLNLQAEAQKRQRDLQNAALVRQNLPALLQKSGGKYDDSVRQGLIAAGVDSPEVESVIGNNYKNLEATSRIKELDANAQKLAADAQQAQQNLRNEAQLHGARVQYDIQQHGYDPVYSTGALMDLAHNDPNAADEVNRALPLMAQNPAAFKAWVDRGASNPALLAEQAGLKGKQAETKETEARAEQATATAAATRENTRALQLSNEAAEQFVKNPAAVLGQGGLIDRLNLNPQTAQRLKAQVLAAYQMPGLPKEKQAVVQGAIQKAISDQNEMERQIQVATDPRIIAADVTKARALRAGDNPALADVPPQLAQFAVNKATQLDQDYAKAKAASDTMSDFITAAESGNKAAAANIPLAGVLQINTANGTRRINRTEIDQYQGAGSLWDRIEGKLGKLKSGQPIPKDVLEDMRSLAGIVGNQAYSQYTTGISNLNQRSKSKFGPTMEGPKAPAPQFKAGDTRVIGGVTYKRDAQGQWHAQ